MKKKLKKRKEKINETKSWFFEKNKIHKPLTKLTKKKKREREPKSIKSEMKKEKLQLTPQKYTTSQEGLP